MKSTRVLPVLLVPALLTGCGGGGGSSPSTGTGSEVAVGDFVGRAAETNPPVVAATSNSILTGMTGAFTSLRLRDQITTKAEQRIAFLCHDTDIRSIGTMNTDGTNRKSAGGAIRHWPSISPDGKKLVFEVSFQVIAMSNTDGSGYSLLTTSSTDDHFPCWGPSSTEIAFLTTRNGFQQIMKMNVTTKAVTPVTTSSLNLLEHPIAWSPDGTKFAAVRSDGNIVIISATTGNVLESTSGGDSTNPVFGPDSSSFAFLQTNETKLMVATMAGAPRVLYTNPNGIGRISFSADGNEILLTQDVTDIGSQAFWVKVQGNSNPVLIPGSIAATEFDAAVAPPVKDRVLIGSGGLFGSTGAGFIYSQDGDTTLNLLAFGATTQSTVVMRALNGDVPNPPNLVYSIDADTITYISYATNPDYTVKKVVGPGLGVTQCDGALISYNSANGQVAAVLPYNGTRGAGRPTFKDSGSKRTFTGNFTAVFNADGENVARGGTTQVELDLATGRITAR